MTAEGTDPGGPAQAATANADTTQSATRTHAVSMIARPREERRRLGSVCRMETFSFFVRNQFIGAAYSHCGSARLSRPFSGEGCGFVRPSLRNIKRGPAKYPTTRASNPVAPDRVRRTDGRRSRMPRRARERLQPLSAPRGGVDGPARFESWAWAARAATQGVRGHQSGPGARYSPCRTPHDDGGRCLSSGGGGSRDGCRSGPRSP